MYKNLRTICGNASSLAKFLKMPRPHGIMGLVFHTHCIVGD